MTRRFAPGQTHDIGGLLFRVDYGKKQARQQGEIDLRLEVYNGSGWVPVSMVVGFFLADFFHENEDVLYPPEVNPNWKGGGKYLSDCRSAARDSWSHAAEKLRLERKYQHRDLFGEAG